MTSADEILEEAFDDVSTPIRFQHRPDPIPGDLRLGWRLSAITLVLDQCRGKTANPEQVHLLLWGLRTSGGRKLVRRWFSEGRRPDDPFVRYDPSLTRTIALAVAGGIVVRNTNQTFTLTERGKSMATAVRSQEGVLADEKRLLAELPKSITQARVRQMLEWR